MTIWAQPGATFECESSGATTGLTGTIGVRIRNGATGVDTVARTTAGITEQPAGSGVYFATLTAPSASGQYTIMWDTGGATPVFAVDDLDVSTVAPILGSSTIRDHVETGLSDGALATLVAEATAQVEGRFGTDAAITTRLRGGGKYLHLQRAAQSITSIQEANEQRTHLYTIGALNTDYDLLYGGRTLVRLSGGTIYYWQSWAPVVDVVYTPKPEQAIRDRVVIDLVKLAVQYNGLQQEQVGGRTGYMSLSQDYLKERERILAGTVTARGFRYA